MIIQDKQQYHMFIKTTKQKVNNLYDSIKSGPVPEKYKRDMDAVRANIMTELAGIRFKLDADMIIRPADFEIVKNKIDGLMRELSDKINMCANYLHQAHNCDVR